MYLKPSEIFYSQDSINNVFDKRCKHSYKQIGETLDELCEGRCSLSSIPPISVILKDGKWVTADNRRLWVFRHLERLGKCEKIFVQKRSRIPEEKLTSYNGGATVRVRGPPGGVYRIKPSVRKPSANISYPKMNVSKHHVITSPTSSSIKRVSPVFNYQLNRTTSSGYGSFANNEGSERFSARHVPEERVHNHKTYDTSYDKGRQNESYRSTETKDNGCCIII